MTEKAGLIYGIEEAAQLLNINVMDLLKLGAIGEIEFKIIYTGNISYNDYATNADGELRLDDNGKKIIERVSSWTKGDLVKIDTSTVMDLYHKSIKQIDLEKMTTTISRFRSNSGREVSVGDNYADGDDSRKIIDVRDLIIDEETFRFMERKQENANVDCDSSTILDVSHRFHAPHLKIALEAWTTLFGDSELSSKPAGGYKKHIEDWLAKNHSDLSNNAQERISTLINPDSRGGAPKINY